MRPEPRIGYVLKRYPRLSETFVVQEILAREAAGERIAIAALRPAGDPCFHPAVAAVRAPVTWVPRPTGSEALWEAMERALPELPRVLPELLALRPADAVQVLHVAQWVRETGVTHLHAHFATIATTVARLAGRLAGVPYSFTAHAKDLYHHDVDHDAVRAMLAEAHHVVTISDHNARWLADTFGAAAARVARVHNGLDPATIRFREPRDREARVAFVGRLVAKKGLPDLIDAMALLRERGRPTPLDVVGSGPLSETARRQVDELGLTGLVRFHGPLPADAVAGIVGAASVFAAPCVHAPDGDRDGLPTVLLEAMALGTPCVATTVTGIPEAVRHDRTGLLVPERDPAALADAITVLLDDPARGIRLARAARALVEDRFDRADQAAALARLVRGERTPDPASLPVEVPA
ncbi:glycosyltransferase [Pseudonocardia nematodicida]|uniref:Glycosyltransferase n=1 Tax=Pseudonocardia nematodicida TaxID=1206997 RepID=A0ABV1KFY8_9PSEU